MRAMLDAHPLVRWFVYILAYTYFFINKNESFYSGEETRVIPRILALRAQWKKSDREWRRLQEAGVNDQVINAAISSFIVQV